MGKFLTGRVELEQTDKPKIWKLLNNVLYEDDDKKIYVTPATFNTDLYTIPTLVDFLVCNSSTYDARCCATHDLFCSTISAVYTTLTADELIYEGFLKYSLEKEKWICNNIPKDFLRVEPMTKGRANDIFGRCLKAAEVPIPQRWILRAGTCFNVGFYTNQWLGRTRDVDLDRFYDETFWDFVGRW